MSATATEFCGFAPGVPLANATLVLDVCGRIQFCSEAAAQLFGYRGSELLGRPVRGLIPDLPLRPATSGYNMAYVRFRFGDGAWHPFWGVGADKRAIPIEVSLGMLKLGDKRGFVLAFQHPVKHSASEADSLRSSGAHAARVTDIRARGRLREAIRVPNMRSRH